MIINFCIDIYELINNIMLTNKVNYYYNNVQQFLNDCRILYMINDTEIIISERLQKSYMNDI